MPGAPQASGIWQCNVSGYHRQRDHEHGCTQPVFPSRQSSNSNLHGTLTPVLSGAGAVTSECKQEPETGIHSSTIVGRVDVHGTRVRRERSRTVHPAAATTTPTAATDAIHRTIAPGLVYA